MNGSRSAIGQWTRCARLPGDGLCFVDAGYCPLVNGRGQVSGVLLDRRTECQLLDQLIADVRAGESGALVVRGEAGIGKTALLDFLAQRASGCRLHPGGRRRVGNGTPVRRRASAVRIDAGPVSTDSPLRSATRCPRLSA